MQRLAVSVAGSSQSCAVNNAGSLQSFAGNKAGSSQSFAVNTAGISQSFAVNYAGASSNMLAKETALTTFGSAGSWATAIISRQGKSFRYSNDLSWTGPRRLKWQFM
jgi:hypothetical protein